jgi:hypothetical protein
VLLECDRCKATWWGPYDREPCAYCIASARMDRAAQAALTLTPPDVPEHVWETACEAWAGRLGRAVEAGLVTQRDADRAWKRARRDHEGELA